MTGALIILGAYVVYLPWIPGAYTTPKLLAVSAGALLGLWTGLPRPDAPPLRRPFAAVVGAALVSSLLADSPAMSLAGRSMATSGGFPGVLLAWLCYEAGAVAPKADRPWLLLGAALTALAAISQWAVDWPIVGALPGGRTYGLAGSPPFLGCMLALAAPLTWREGWLLRGLFVAAIYLTGSRAGFIGYAAGLTVLFLGARKSLLAAGLALSAGLALGPARVAGDGMRIDIWATAAKAFLARPLWGWGVDGFSDAFFLLRSPVVWGPLSIHGVESTHNLLLEILVAGGLVSLAAWIWLGASAWRRRHPQETVAATVAVLAYGCFNPTPFTAFAVLAYVWGKHDAPRA